VSCCITWHRRCYLTGCATHLHGCGACCCYTWRDPTSEGREVASVSGEAAVGCALLDGGR
jgi:hypothetical protein